MKSGVKTMKFTPIIFAAATAVALMTAPASAEDITQLCIDTVTADAAAAGAAGDAAAIATSCACLAAKAEGDADLTKNLVEGAAMAAGPERDAHRSEASAAAVAECFPQPAAE